MKKTILYQFELSSPEAAHGLSLNRNASERSSMKNPEKFKAFVDSAATMPL
jgi:hypothetical protein